ncbi:MAG TPA: hypothetical protein VFE46_15765 [Pirellulales bacterium]|nr:hypothetical protein [Pirellulales bacterium]
MSENGAITFWNDTPALPFLGDPPQPGVTFRTGSLRGYHSDIQDARILSKVFRWFARPSTHAWRVPDWFFAMLAAAFARLPWWRGWNSRFSLRALLIAMTLLAIAFGLLTLALRGCKQS